MPLINQTFSQLITFTRASSATYVDARGLIQSASTNVPRFDYNPSTLAPRGILIEEQRTNLLRYSEEFDNAVWIRGSSTLSNNAAISPDGTTTAEKSIVNNGIVLGVSSGAGLRQDWTKAASSITYTQSLFAKAAEFNSIFLFLSNLSASSGVYGVFNLATGTVGATSSFGSGFSGLSTTIENYGNGWYRCILTVTSDSSTGMRNSYFPTDTVATTGNGTSGVLVWGAQLEAGAFPTSYIPTVASQVTRAADVASVNNLSPWYNMNQGTLFAEFVRVTTSTTARVFQVDNGTSNNRLYIGGDIGGGLVVVAEGVTQAAPVSGTITAGVVVKIAGAYKVNDFAVSTNASTVGVDTSGALPFVDRTRIGSSEGATGFVNGHIRRIVFYPSRLSNANLQTITA